MPESIVSPGELPGIPRVTLDPWTTIVEVGWGGGIALVELVGAFVNKSFIEEPVAEGGDNSQQFLREFPFSEPRLVAPYEVSVPLAGGASFEFFPAPFEGNEFFTGVGLGPLPTPYLVASDDRWPFNVLVFGPIPIPPDSSAQLVSYSVEEDFATEHLDPPQFEEFRIFVGSGTALITHASVTGFRDFFTFDFRKTRTLTINVQGSANLSDINNTVKISAYPAGTSFSLNDANEYIGSRDALWSGEVSKSGDFTGEMVKFNRAGLVE